MSRIINTGIASFGMSGKVFHAPFLKASPHFKLYGIVERQKNDSREKYADTKLYRSFEEMIADENVELVVVNTPVQTHYGYAKAALEAGKDVVVEKPFTVNAAEAAELEAIAEANNRFLSVYQNRRYDGDYKAVRDIVKENMLGTLKEAELRFDRYRPEHSGKNHKEGSQPGAGILHDLGAHLIDQAIQLFGFPEAVYADVMTMRPNLEANDYFEIIFYYNRPFRVRIKGSMYVREPYFAYILHGEQGTYLQQRSDIQEERLAAGDIPAVNTWITPVTEADGRLHTNLNGEEIKKDTNSLPGNYMDYYEEVYQALLGKRENPVPAHDAVLTMKIIDAALQSSRERRAVTVTP